MLLESLTYLIQPTPLPSLPPSPNPPFTPTHSYIDIADEPDSIDRSIQFTIFDGNFNASDRVILPILTIDDNPTVIRNHVSEVI